MELTEFEEKVLGAIAACRDYDDFYEEQFIKTLHEIMPPTCTATERKFLDTFVELSKKGLPQFCDKNERKFLDEFRIKFKWGVSFDDPKGYVTYFRENGDFVYKLSQSEFESILKELVNE